MPMPDYPSVDAYLEAQSVPARAALERVRATIRKAIPKAVETVTYKIPTYKRYEKPVLFFAAWKQHWSLYPVSAALLAKVADADAAFDVEKDTLRFSYDAPVPVQLIARLAKLREKEVVATAKAKSEAKAARDE